MYYNLQLIYNILNVVYYIELYIIKSICIFLLQKRFLKADAFRIREFSISS